MVPVDQVAWQVGAHASKPDLALAPQARNTNNARLRFRSPAQMPV